MRGPTNLGKRGANAKALTDERLALLENLIQHIPSRTSRFGGAAKVFGRIRWDIDGDSLFGGVDDSEAEIVQDDGTSYATPGRPVWIDAATSIRPELVGDAYYELEMLTRGTSRSGDQRPLFKAVRYVGLGSEATAWTRTGATLSSGTVGVTTDICGDVKANVLPLMLVRTSGATARIPAGYVMSLPGRLRWTGGLASSVIPEVLLRKRDGFYDFPSSGNSGKLEYGESCEISIHFRGEHLASGLYKHLVGSFTLGIARGATFKAYGHGSHMLIAAPSSSAGAYVDPAVVTVNFGGSSVTTSDFLKSNASFGKTRQLTLASTTVSASPFTIHTILDETGATIATLTMTYTIGSDGVLDISGITLTGVLTDWTVTVGAVQRGGHE